MLRISRVRIVLGFVLILALLAAACGATPTATPPLPTATKPAPAPTATTPPPPPTATKPAPAPTATTPPPPTATKPAPAPTATTAAASYPLTLTDYSGRKVTIAKAPERIVSVAPSATEILFAIGAGSKLVGVGDADDYPPEATKIAKIGGYPLNFEKIAALAPDLVVGAGITVPADIAKLESLKLTVFTVDAKTAADVPASIELMGQAVGAAAQAKQVAAGISKRLADLEAKVKTATTKPRVFFELDNTLFTVGPGSFIDDMITRAGGANVAADAKNSFPQMNLEALVTKDPEVIILSDAAFGETAAKVKARQGWAGMSAVKNGRIVEVSDANAVSRPGPRIADGIEILARAIHPELFK